MSGHAFCGMLEAVCVSRSPAGHFSDMVITGKPAPEGGKAAYAAFYSKEGII